MKEPDTIAVNVELERKVYASSAEMCVEIRGDSLISGNAALKKAHEVRELVGALAAVGIPENGIQVIGLPAEVASGIVTRSSSAVYRLRVEVPALDLVADVLGVVMSRKNASLTRVDWQYADMQDLHNEMLSQALLRADERARLICSTLHHRNLGVHSLTEKFRDCRDDEARYIASPRALVSNVARSPLAAEDLGLDVTHAKTVALNVRIEYHVQCESHTARPEATDGKPSP